METEGRFNRALREAKVHGTSIQIFNIIYNHAWTSFFWFHDVEATYSDYLKLKDYTKRTSDRTYNRAADQYPH